MGSHGLLYKIKGNRIKGDIDELLGIEITRH